MARLAGRRLWRFAHLVLAWCAVASAAAADPARTADAHLLAGAEHFRAERFTEALVEFRVAEKLGAGGEATWYAAASLVKLQRPEEALEAFAIAERRAPEARDALLDYYRALACHAARLYTCADTVLRNVEQRSAGRIAAQARKVREGLRPVLGQLPGPETLAWYHARGQEALDAQRPSAAAAYFREAMRVAQKRNDPEAVKRARAQLDDALQRALREEPTR
jgi:hypothetical protein